MYLQFTRPDVECRPFHHRTNCKTRKARLEILFARFISPFSRPHSRSVATNNKQRM